MSDTILIVLASLSFLCGILGAWLVVVHSQIKGVTASIAALKSQHGFDTHQAKDAINGLEQSLHKVAESTSKDVSAVRNRLEELNNRIMGNTFKR